MAEYLASIYGTEKDKVNCSFYFKIGACRHGDRCSRKHNKFKRILTIFTKIFLLNCANTEKLKRCIYEEDAQKAVDNLNQRFYAGRPIYAELSPVTDFREACCRQNENAECTRGGFCNFMHLKEVSRYLKKELFAAQRNFLREQRRVKREKSEIM
ncbi:uncharacterized protein OCT59_006500 [Rhizophagus irregularis]|uniref:uncharacterized protein n=1 Tax=Rhizophagus irregularis TaxID=588596 RepID=UPI0033318FF2|nr:hypothetical protein OCT59_006500 [Rhizophagus irregularis]